VKGPFGVVRGVPTGEKGRHLLGLCGEKESKEPAAFESGRTGGGRWGGGREGRFLALPSRRMLGASVIP